MSDIYPTGAMDPYIRLALDRAALVREIYRRVANVQHPDDWHPLGVVCPTCGKIGTTIVTKWDGEKVFFECRADLVTWARGCGTSGWISRSAAPPSCPGTSSGPPSGRSSASRSSRAARTSRPPAARATGATRSPARSSSASRRSTCPTSSSTSAARRCRPRRARAPRPHTIAEVIPPEQLRFLFLRPRPNNAIEFDPDGTDAIPRLFDEFDRVADAAAGREVKGTLPPSPERLFGYALLATEPAAVAERAAAFRLAFAHVAFLIQQPAVDVASTAVAEKGSPLTPLEAELLTERATAARRWLDTYAPEEARVAVRTDGAAGRGPNSR